jgi:hypothetical protein
MIAENTPRHAAASVDYAMRQGIQIFYERGLDGNMGEGVWEVKGSVREDDRQAMMRENKISKEATVDNDSEGKGKDQNIGKPIKKKGGT